MTFDESTPCASSTFECASDQEMRKSIFVDGDLPALGDEEDDPLLPSTTLGPELAPASSTPAESPAATTSTSASLDPAPAVFEGEVVSRREAPQHIQR